MSAAPVARTVPNCATHSDNEIACCEIAIFAAVSIFCRKIVGASCPLIPVTKVAIFSEAPLEPSCEDWRARKVKYIASKRKITTALL